jgi:hypothetical protein
MTQVGAGPASSLVYPPASFAETDELSGGVADPIKSRPSNDDAVPTTVSDQPRRGKSWRYDRVQGCCQALP